MISLPRWRFIAAALGVLFVMHLLFSIHPTYRDKTAFGILPSSWGGQEIGSWKHSVRPNPLDSPQVPTMEELRYANGTDAIENRERANAAFVILARNSDLGGIRLSLKQIEDRFNFWAKYDYVFLNDDDFSEDFKKHTSGTVSTNCKYGKIPKSHWVQPDWIDEDKAKASREELTRQNVIYGFSVPYRNMCRFNSGFFFRHPLLAQYDYYWRIEPDVRFFCDIPYDPFLFMKRNGKKYGFTVALLEYHATIPSLWDETKKFIKAHPQYVHKNNAMGFLSDDGGDSYNLCHFWSNFEIGDLNFWRSQPYLDYFQHLEDAGGFYYERWGDAPVHSIAAALFLDKNELHWFDDIGYRHDPFQHCPQGEAYERGKCWCNPEDNFDWTPYSCMPKWVRNFK